MRGFIMFFIVIAGILTFLLCAGLIGFGVKYLVDYFTEVLGAV